MTVADGPGESCESCGAELDRAARFCSSCGRPVGAGSAGERKIVTVVFADLAGFTSLAESRDPEAVKDLLDRCFGRLVPVVVEHGGTVDKIIGDELMAVFGAPVAHENDPDRAVRAALDLIAELADLSASLVLRIGINTGEVLVGPLGPGGSSTVTGDTVNTAHRLASVARPGEILVGERTWAATEDTVEYDDRPPYELKGRQAPVQARAAVRARGAAARRAPVGVGNSLVGRSGELGQLARQAERTVLHAEPAVALITGEAGIGKTRLAVELAASAWSTAPRRVLWTTCPAYGGDGLEPVAELIRAALDIDGSQPRRTQRTALDRRLAPAGLPLAVDRPILTDRIAHLLGLDDGTDHTLEPDGTPGRARVVDQLLASAHQVLAAVASTTPLLIVVDDLQWADDAVLDFLERIPARMGTSPVLVLALGRDELLERGGAFRSGRKGITSFALRSLTELETASLLEALLAQQRPGGSRVPIGHEAGERILAAAGGNPLLLEQIVQYMAETGTLSVQDDRWQVSSQLDEIGMPDGVRALIGARLDALPAHERLVTQHASVIGRRFWAEGVQALLGEGSTDATSAIAALMARGLVESVAHDPRPGDYAFRHVLTRDVAYASVPLGERATRHAAVARWLTRRFPEETTGRLAGLLAHHYERAVLLNRELDLTDPGLAGAAFAALVRAARDAQRREATREAEAWFRRARDLGTLDHDLELEVMLAHGMVLLDLRRLDDAQATFEQLRRRTALRVGDPMAQALGRRAIGRLAAVARLQGDQDTARDLFESAQVAAREAGDLLGEADTARLSGWTELTAGRARSALPRLRRAAELERRAGVGARAETLQALGWSEFSVGEIEDAQAHLWQAASQAGTDGDRGQVVWCFGILCFTFLQFGRVEQATQLARDLIDAAHANGDPWGEGLCTVLLAACRSAAGEVDECESLAHDALRRFDELGEPWGQVMAHVVLGSAARLRGATDEARVLLRTGLETARRVTYVGEDARLLTELAAVDGDAGDDDESARRARAALALVRSGLGDEDTGMRALIVLAEATGRAGDPDAAELLLEEAVALRRSETATDTWRQANARLAVARAQRGDLAGAEVSLAAADDGTAESVRTISALGLARAQLAVRAGRDGEARAVLDDILGPPGAPSAHAHLSVYRSLHDLRRRLATEPGA